MANRLLIADDHVTVREGLKQILLEHGFEIVAEASNGYEAVELVEKLIPDVAMLDISMPLLNGLEAAREIRKTNPETKIVVLSVHKDKTYLSEAMKAGINGYVLKSQAVSELIQAIRVALSGETYTSPEIVHSSKNTEQSNLQRDCAILTPQERKVLTLISKGMTNKEMSRQLGVSIKTVESHRTNLMKKLDIHETASLVRHAIKIGLVEP